MIGTAPASPVVSLYRDIIRSDTDTKSDRIQELSRTIEIIRNSGQMISAGDVQLMRQQAQPFLELQDNDLITAQKILSLRLQDLQMHAEKQAVANSSPVCNELLEAVGFTAFCVFCIWVSLQNKGPNS
jgi:hypothetical protein